MIERITEHFAPGPFFAWVCAAGALLIPVIWLRACRPARLPSVRYSSLTLLRAVRPSLAARLWFAPPLLRTAAVITLLVALARPQSGGEYRDTREGIAIQMVLDVSGSMSEQDFALDGQPVRRLDAVKRVFESFVGGGSGLKGRENDLIGMTTFAMFADAACPLTVDHGSLLDLLRETDIPGWVNGRQVRENPEAGNTSLGEAIVLATDDLRRAGEQAVQGVPGAESAKSRVMILLTDGKDNPPRNLQAAPPDPLEAARVAATLGIKIYTIGAIGSHTPSRGFSMFAPARAEVDEPTLKEIARITGAKYFRATDTESLAQVYDEIDRMETRRTGERSFSDHIYAAKIAMLTGLALLSAEFLLLQTRYRRIP